MHNAFTAVFERDADWHIAYSPEIPGANGQGRTTEEARESLAARCCSTSASTDTFHATPTSHPIWYGRSAAASA